MFEVILNTVRSVRTRLQRLRDDEARSRIRASRFGHVNLDGRFPLAWEAEVEEASEIRRRRRALWAPLLITVAAVSIAMAGRATRASTLGRDLALRYQECAVVDDVRFLTGTYAVRQAIHAMESILVAAIYDADPAIKDSIRRGIGEPLSVRKTSP